MSGRPLERPRVQAALLFALACALRLAYLALIADEPAARYPVLDAHAYHHWALAILDGDWLGDRVYYQDPLYPFFLAGLYALFGAGSLAVLVAQAVLDATSVVLLHATARRVFPAGAALLAGLLACGYAVYVYYAALLLKAPLLVFLFTLSLWLLVRAAQLGRPRDWLAFGVAFGFAALTRGNALLFLPALVLWLARERERPLARRVGAIAASCGGVLLVLLPVAARNWAVGGDLVLLNSQAGQNFYIGNFRGNDTGAYRAPPFLRATPEHEEEDFAREAVAAVGHPLTPGAVSRYWFARGLDEIAADPAHFARNLARKLAVLANHVEVPDNYSFAFFADEVAPPLAWPWPSWGLLLPLACCGAWFARGRREARLLLLYGACYALGLLIFFNLSRLRLPLVPLVLVFGAFGATEIAARLRARDWRPALAAAGFLLLAYPAVHADLGSEGPAIRFFNLAQAQQARGRAHRERAVALSSGGDERGAAAELARAHEEFARAEQSYRAGLLHEPRSPRLAGGLRALLEVRILELERLGRSQEALRAARSLVETAPDHAEGHARLGRLLLDAGERDAARDAFRRALALDPENLRARRGLLKLDFGRRPEAGAGATGPEPGA